MLATLTALALLLSATSQTPEVVERSYDLRALDSFAEFDATVPDPRLPLDALRLDSLEADPHWLEWPDAPTHGVSWLGVLGDLLTEQESELVESMDYEGDALVVRATPELHTLIDELLAELESVVLRDCRFEVHLLDPAGLQPGDVGVVSAQRAAELVRSSAARGGQVVRGSIGRPNSFRMVGAQAALIGFDVEVAQHASGKDPQVSVISSGLEGGYMVNARLDGSLTLRAWARWSEFDRPLKRVVVGTRGEELQLPSARAVVAVASGTLRASEALVLSGKEFPHALLMRPRVEQPEQKAPRQLALFDLIDTLEPPFVVQPLVTLGPPPSGGWYLEEVRHPVDAAEPMTADDVTDLLEQELERPFAVVGPLLCVRATDSEHEPLARTVAGVTVPFLATYDVEVRGGTVSRTRALELETKLGPEVEGELPLLAAGATLEGGSLAISAGEQHAYVGDYDVEIAQAAFEAQPILRAVFGGTKFWARITRGGDEEVDVEFGVLRSVVEDLGEPLGVSDPDTEFPGLSFPTVTISDHWAEHPLPLDEWVHVQTDGIDAEHARVLVLRIRRSGE